MPRRWSLHRQRTSFSDSNLILPAMTSRISIARPNPGAYGQTPYQPDPPSYAASTPGYKQANPDDPIQRLQGYAKLVEDYVEIYSQPLKPHLPAIGRFLIVVTFLEDSLRTVTQWGDQLWYLQKYVSWHLLTTRAYFSPSVLRHRHFPWGISHLFLLINVVVSVTSA